MIFFWKETWINLIKESFVKIPKDAEFASLISGMYLINRPGPDDTKIVNGWKRIGANFTVHVYFIILLLIRSKKVVRICFTCNFANRWSP